MHISAFTLVDPVVIPLYHKASFDSQGPTTQEAAVGAKEPLFYTRIVAYLAQRVSGRKNREDLSPPRTCALNTK
jgi:hypothetical protein